jgi:hypothetical protein
MHNLMAVAMGMVAAITLFFFLPNRPKPAMNSPQSVLWSRVGVSEVKRL